MSDSDRAWQKWGDTDPYFGVLTEDKYRKETLDEHRGEFFLTGEAHIQQRIARFERHFGPLVRHRALDFGCGVGRLTLALAGLFEEAVGVDISTSMLNESKRNAAVRNIENVQFVLSDDTLSLAAGQFNFVHTYIVLQHIPVRRGLNLIRGLLDRTAPKGGISLHLSIDRRDSLLQSLRYWGQRNVHGLQGLANLTRGRAWSEPLMQMNNYPLHIVFDMMRNRDFGEVVVDFEEHGRVLTASLTAQRA